MEHRRESRIEKNLLVNISANGYDQVGLTANISRGGLLLVTTNLIPHQKDISILIAAGDDLFEVKGEIRWMLMGPEEMAMDTPHRVGVKVLSAPDHFYTFIGSLEVGSGS